MLADESINVTGVSKKIIATHHPTTTEEIIQLVKSARLSNTPLYPISTGFNWGYGSRSPVAENCELIDLGKMNRILNAPDISAKNPVAVIEPGVTQIQLYDYLQTNCPELTFNVTGSGKDTSIIGNALERGVGYLGPRRDDLFGLEIVTGTGEIIQTGFRRLGESSPLAHTHPFGLGPMLDGLFFQGNFGIVVSACFRLYPKRPKMVAISLSPYKSADFSQFINELAKLKREKLLTSVTHIANRERTRTTLYAGITDYLKNKCNLRDESIDREIENTIKIIAPNEWTCLASVSGNSKQVKAIIQEIKNRVSRFARIRVITDRRLDIGFNITHFLRFFPTLKTIAAAIHTMRPLHKLVLGMPSDIAVENLLLNFDHSNRHPKELDASRCGLLYISPALPSDGEFVVKIVDEMKVIAARYGHSLYITINIETETSLVAITNLLFDRAYPEEVKRAHRCADELLTFLHSNGLELYRARADSMKDITEPMSSYWKMVRSLKQVFDPDNIIAPGRYNLL